ncbi:MAG: DUF3825 domain-containing protein [Prevotella sp.]|nr:DUF3825 domain-containing protein [Bacteroides sp.]MCM1365972.1 DUF3825 domain-containing protein [Prevotella sp.]MCM1436607.1 DUF3825 domain-containing protein [Prevotella sp.]
MAYNDLFEALLMVVYLLKDEKGLARLSEVIEQLHQRGLLSSFADDDVSFKDIISSEEFSSYIEKVEVEDEKVGDDDDNIIETVERYSAIRLTELGIHKAEELNRARYANPQSLFNWGFMAGFDSKLKILADMALPENWSEGEQPYGILRAYITNTFKRLLHMRKNGDNYAIVEAGKWAVFNTGLVDRMYDPIYALFSVNRKEGMQKWVFNSWTTPGSRRSGQILTRHFVRLPRRASYFDKPEDLLYDSAAGVPTLPFEHILERLDRLPLSYLAQFVPSGFDWPCELHEPDEKFYDDFRDSLYCDDFTRMRFKDALELSLRRAVKKVKWNYRMLIPVYDTKRRKLMQLIPMSLDFANSNKVDIALMVEKAKLSGRYVGHTILTPGMAYRKARMVMTQDSDWLSPSLIDLEVKSRSSEDEELDRDIIESDANAIAVTSVKEREEAEVQTNVDDELSFGFLTQHDDDEIFRPETERIGPKVLGKVDVSSYNKSFLFRNTEKSEEVPIEKIFEEDDNEQPTDNIFNQTKFQPERKKVIKIGSQNGVSDSDYDIPGIYKYNYGNPYIQVGKFRYQAREFTDEDLIDDDEVIFDVRKEPNMRNTGTFFYAVNIRLADEYEFEYDDE